MPEIQSPHKSYVLKFRHVCARVTVIEEPAGYLAFIVFPRAYMAWPQRFYHALPHIVATSFDYAYEMALVQFKQFYWPLDKQIRRIGDFNFFVQRILFRIAIERQVGDFKARFVITRQFYGISENVDGVKYPKTLFDNRERTTTYRALFLINLEQVFQPMQMLGFNGKFIQRLLLKNDKVKATRLKLYDDGLFVDDLEKNPEWMMNHVADMREEFERAIWFEKLRKQLDKPNL